jgi:hypothetical protein
VVVVGYAANNVIPVRIGEVVRSYYLGVRENVSTAGAFGTIAVERAADVVTLLFFLALAWLALPVGGAFDRVADQTPGGAPVLAVAALLPFIVVTALVVALALTSHETALKLFERVMSPAPERARMKALGLIGRLLEGLTVVRFSNSHLVYALTWFGLALMVVGAAVVVARYESRLRAAYRSHTTHEPQQIL